MTSKLLPIENEHFIFPPVIIRMSIFPSPDTPQVILRYLNLIGNKRYDIGFIYIFIINQILYKFFASFFLRALYILRGN